VFENRRASLCGCLHRTFNLPPGAIEPQEMETPLRGSPKRSLRSANHKRSSQSPQTIESGDPNRQVASRDDLCAH
jgi:hypothetical protein